MPVTFKLYRSIEFEDYSAQQAMCYDLLETVDKENLMKWNPLAPVYILTL